MNRLEGRVAFITGAGTGIGREAALLFAREGARVAIADVNADLGRESEVMVREEGGKALYVETDVTQEESGLSKLEWRELMEMLEREG